MLNNTGRRNKGKKDKGPLRVPKKFFRSYKFGGLLVIAVVKVYPPELQNGDNVISHLGAQNFFTRSCEKYPDHLYEL